MRARIVVTVGLLVMIPLCAWAQVRGAAIGGIVRDTTGAVLPGVTVEASSPALIEKVRTAVTDGGGQFRIIELEPGVYTVAFALPGFGSFRREGVEISTGFTATINAELKVGDLTESITVAGESPIVDVQNVQQQTVMTRQVMETIPTSRNFASLGKLIPGMVAVGFQSGGQDIGGAIGRDSVRLGIHGGRTQDFALYADGLSQAGLQQGAGDNTSAPPAEGIAEEINIQTGAHSAEMETGGVIINIVGKSGGNTPQGSVFYNFSHSSLQADNLDPALTKRYGIAASGIDYLSDVNPVYGGPIARDRLWYFGSFRDFRSTRFSPVYPDTNPTDWAYIPDTSGDPARDDRPQWNVDGRMTWQATPRNKISGSVQVADACFCHLGLANNRAPEATIRSNYRNRPFTNVRWTAPMTSRLLVEAGAQINRGIQDGRPLAAATAPGAIDQRDNISFRSYTGSGGTDGYTLIEYRYAYMRGAVSYVTGAHAFKVGATLWPGTQSLDIKLVDNNFPYFVTLLNGVPTRVTYRAEPYLYTNDMFKGGLFVQDQWTRKRATINAGVRLDWLDSSYPDQTVPATKILPQRSFPGADVLSWRDLSPRLGLAYDLFGTGRTAIKVSASRYVIQETFNETANNNAVRNTAALLARNWNDTTVCPTCISRDFIPQGDPLNPAVNGELGTSPNNLFGTSRVTTRTDPNALGGWGHRGYNWEFAFSMQHELLPRVSVNAAYFRRVFGNFLITDNVAVAPSDYSIFSIVAPLDARLPNGGGYTIGGLYDLNPDKVGQLDNLQTLASNYGKQYQHYNGADVGMTARLGQGVMLQAGMNIGKNITDNCDVVTKVDNPSQLYCHKEHGLLPQGSIMGSYTLPWAIQVAATYQNQPIKGSGTSETIFGASANYVATNALIRPSLGRNLSSGANGTVTVNLIEPGSMFGPERLQQVDLRFARSFTSGPRRLKIMVDMYNVLNVAPFAKWNNTYGTDGASWLAPLDLLPGRFLKFGLQMDF